MEQRCTLANVWLSWLTGPLLAAVIGWRLGWLVGAAVLVLGVGFQILCIRWYIRFFPRLSGMLGYGKVDDVPAGSIATTVPASQHVTLYTASACPFCPIVRGRLAALQQQLGFTLDEVDVTLRPDVVRAKGLRAVPVVECNGRTIVGNATSQQLAVLLTTASPARV